MDPTRSGFNGLPPNAGSNNGHNRQQQVPGFPYQFQNPQLSSLGGMQQNRLNMQGLLRQQLDPRPHQHHHSHQHQHSYNDHRDLLAALSRQNNAMPGNGFSQHPNQMTFHQQHQQAHQRHQKQQGSMFFKGDQFHRHAQSQSQTNRLKSPYALLQEENERRQQQELKEESARQFREFLLSRQISGQGSQSAGSPTVADRQRSSSFISNANSEEAALSPHLRSKRAFSNVADDIHFSDGNQEILKRMKPEDEDPQHMNMNLNMSMGANVADIGNNINHSVNNVDMMSEVNGQDRQFSEEKNSNNGVEFVGTIENSSTMDAKTVTNGDSSHTNNLKSHESTNDTWNLYKNAASNPPTIDSNMEAREQYNAMDGSDGSNDDGDGSDDDDDDAIVIDSEETQPEPGLQQSDESPRKDRDIGTVREITNVSLLLEAAKTSEEPFAEKSDNTSVDAMQILAEATVDIASSRESEDEHDIADRNAARLFASIKDIPVDAADVDGLENMFEAPKPSNEEEEPKGEVEAMLSRLPELPSEPSYIPNNVGKAEESDDTPKEVPLDVKEPVYIPNEEEEREEPLYYSSIDTWFPSNNAIKREKKKSKGVSIAYEMKLRNGEKVKVTTSMHSRLGKSAEPGVLDKLPHCKIHERMFQAQYGKLSKEPLFCCQVTEIYCNSTMLCCSVCSTWRHAECGGHHTFYSPKMREAHFEPICDRCYKENQLLQKYPQAEKRIARQRSIHLRKTHVAADIMRHAAYAKHGGTYKWPLGSVSHNNIGGHSRSVHIRHERSEKQWKEMLHKLNAATAGKRERVKQRTKELERVLNNLEEAEGKTDRHNMILFLQRDSQQRYPTGFENPQLNFFDPEEDHVRLACLKDKASKVDLQDLDIQSDSESSESSSSSSLNDDTASDNRKEMEMPAIPSPNENFQTVLGRAKAIATKPKKKAAKYCTRTGCKRKPRFDSAFCSDACGVSVMETDLLRSLSFANNMHPYNLRS